jgi:glutamine synthetase adenylyltransferase
VIQQTLLPAMLGWFADAADPDAGLKSFRQVSDTLGGTPWYLRLLRDEGQAAERLARLLASSRYVADLLGRAPEAVRLLAADDELVPRPGAALEHAFVQVARRRDDWEGTVAAARGMRRHELLRVACADLLGLLDLGQVGAALSDVAGAVLAAALETATRKVEAERRTALPVTMAVLAMGRLGGREQGYGSDADVLFVHEAHEGRSRTAWPRRRRTTSPTSCAACSPCPPPTRRSSSTPTSGRRDGRGRSAAACPPTWRTTTGGRTCGRRRRCCGPPRSSATPGWPPASWTRWRRCAGPRAG